MTTPQDTFDGLPTYPGGEPTSSDPLTAGFAWGRRFLRVSLPLLFCSWMLVEWLRYPDITPFFGPFAWMCDANAATRSDGRMACVVLLPCLFAFPVKPNVVTLCVSWVAGMIWVFMAVLLFSASC